jgi:hypothetical protein
MSRPVHRGRTRGLSTVAELARISHAELRRRHDRARVTGEPASDTCLGELGRRLHELRDQRLALGPLAVSSAVLILGIDAHGAAGRAEDAGDVRHAPCPAINAGDPEVARPGP